jgi:MFS-type transporter involved in bile tolerance (Atg22 family)
MRVGMQFFGLFGLTGPTSSVIGPNVIQAIIDKTGNTWQGFTFMFAINLASSLVIWLALDVAKGRRDAQRWAAEQRGTRCGMHSDVKACWHGSY